MAADPNCIFCKIASGQIPCLKIFEDEVVLAFLDISPLVAGHTLIIPKAHYPTVMDTPSEVLGAISQRIPPISRAVLSASGVKACHLLVNNGSEAMQSVSHLHYHILPRKPGDSFRIPWNTTTLDKTAAAAFAESVKARLSFTG